MAKHREMQSFLDKQSDREGLADFLGSRRKLCSPEKPADLQGFGAGSRYGPGCRECGAHLGVRPTWGPQPREAGPAPLAPGRVVFGSSTGPASPSPAEFRDHKSKLLRLESYPNTSPDVRQAPFRQTSPCPRVAAGQEPRAGLQGQRLPGPTSAPLPHLQLELQFEALPGLGRRVGVGGRRWGKAEEAGEAAGTARHGTARCSAVHLARELQHRPTSSARGTTSGAAAGRGPEAGASGERCPTPSPPGSPGTRHSCSIAPLTPSQSPRSEAHAAPAASFAVVVAIDFGTTSSGYAFSFRSDPEAIHMMRRWEGGDPGVANQKTPTSLLLTPAGTFHSFGYTARDYYHDLDPEEARDWLYFEKFKMKIHSTSDLTMQTELEAVNGRKVRALEVFAHALRFFKQHAVQELQEQCPALPESGAVRWVITVPAIWKQPAKQFMREAAYEVSAAQRWCHHPLGVSPPRGRDLTAALPAAREQLRRSRHSRTFLVESGVGELWAEMQAGDRYIVADCGGGTAALPSTLSVTMVKWSSQGMLRLSPDAMSELFQPTISQIVAHIGELLRKPEVQGVKFLFLVGGFAESPMLQHAVQAAFGGACRVVVPQDVGLTILKGAVLFGLDPGLAGGARGRREIRATMQFGDTEIKVTAVDIRTAKTVRATIDFLSN
ncbi:PREDICTED: heat shock 70 kDa protein 12B-like [Tinamus guttatus]|nr:PREDICTED: heat shock 70 kDa protein 12B-like [Tinamus guttatus]